MWKNIIAILFISGSPPVSEGIFYKFLKISKSFEESRQYCTSAFDGLAEVHNSQQQRVLSWVVKDTAWIGVLRCGGSWCYPSSLSRVSYTNWADGEPNNYQFLFFGGEENCVEMLSSHEWNDEDCDNKNYFVCQIFHCQETTCNRRGTCSELIDGFKCSCNQGYYGNRCENEKCKSTTCNGRGTCSELPTGLRCTCDQGFYGNNCENEKCKSTACNGRGTCSELPTGLRCTCDQGFYGNNCENEKCKSTTCNGRGTCSELPTGLRCTCDQGFYGNNCENVAVCPGFMKPNNSQVKCEGLHGESHFQSVCTFTCETGFVLNGTISTTCQASGVWTAHNTVCQGAVNHHDPVLIVIPVVAGAAVLLIISVIVWRCRRNHQEQADTTNDLSTPERMAEVYCVIPHDDMYINTDIAQRDLK